MTIRIALASIAAAALATTSATAQAAPREAAPVEGEHLGGSPIITIVLIFAILAGILLLAGGSDEPQSP